MLQMGYAFAVENELTQSDADILRASVGGAPEGQIYTFDSFPESGDLYDVDAETNQKNLNWAAGIAKRALGLENIAPSDWTQFQRVAYLNEFNAVVLNSPEMFSEQTVNTAGVMRTFDLGNISPTAEFEVWIQDAFSPVLDAFAEVGYATRAVATAARDAVIGAAKSTSNLSAIAPFVLPAVALGVLWFATRSIGKDPAGQFSKAVGAFR